MSNQPEALRLADALDECKYVDVYRCKQAAAQLRRLHAENESLRQIVHDFPPVEAELREVSDRAHRLEAQRDALLEALRPFAAVNVSVGFTHKDVDRARAAIAAVKEGK